MKKLLSVLLALLMVFALVGCKTETVEEGPEQVKIGCTIYKFDDTFMTGYRNLMANYVDILNEEAGYEKYVLDIQDGKGDQAEQTNQIDTFITQGYDVLIINLVQSSGAATIIDKCAEAGIPAIFINREPSAEDMKLHSDDEYAGKFCYVGADAKESGRMQGEIIAALPDKGDLDGDGVLQYIMLVGDPENVDAEYRTQYSIEQYVESSGLQVECLFQQVGNWQTSEGQELTANALAQFGDEIEVVFANNDDMGAGALTSIQAAGRTVGEDIYLVAVDANDYAIVDELDGTFTGTVLNDGIGQAHTAVDCAIKAAGGEKLDTYYTVHYASVTAENAQEIADYKAKYPSTRD